MDIGMLWFDNDSSTSFQRKVKRASAHYQEKFGRVPDTCVVHPSMVENGFRDLTQDEAGSRVGTLVVEKSERVLPHHFWIGVSNGVE